MAERKILDEKLNRGTKLVFFQNPGIIYEMKIQVPKKKNVKTQVPNRYLTLIFILMFIIIIVVVAITKLLLFF
jgi:hypothetical protein